MRIQGLGQYVHYSSLQGSLEPCHPHQAPVDEIERRRLSTVKERHKREGASEMHTNGRRQEMRGGGDKDRKPLGTLDVGVHAQHARRLDRDRPVVARYHFDLI